jgi:hypothetical protein
LDGEIETNGNDNDTIPVHDNAFSISFANMESLYTFTEKFPTPAHFPEIIVSADIDSVYTFADTAEKIVDAIGTKNRWMIPSITRQWSSDTGTRFSVNSELCENPPFLCKGEAKTVPLNMFPNIKIAVAHIAEFGYDMHVHLYYLGIEKFTSKSHFSLLQMGVVNAMFNGARTAITSCPEDFPASVVCEMRRFENLKTERSRKVYAIERNYLSSAGIKNILPTWHW